MSLSTNLRATAIALIDKYGNDVVLKKADSTTYDVPSGTTIVVEGDSIPLKATYVSYSSDEIIGLIQAGDIKATFSYDASIVFDLASDKIIIDTITYNIVNIIPEIAQNNLITNTLQLRK